MVSENFEKIRKSQYWSLDPAATAKLAASLAARQPSW
jgi:hypothetical protein